MSVSVQDPSYAPFRLFLSYSRQDYPIVRDIYERLTAQGSPVSHVWLDQVEIELTSVWQAEIRRGLDSCDAVLLIASQYALASSNVRDEWLYAQAKGKPVYVWLIDNVPLDRTLADCPRFDLRADPLDGARLGRPIDWLRQVARGEAPPAPDAAAGDRFVLPAYVKAHRRVLIGLQVYATLVQLLVFWLVALDQYRTVPYHVIEGMQVSPLLTAPLAGLAVALDWALFVRQMGRLSRRRMPYEHMMLYFVGTTLLKLLIPVLIMPPYTGPLLILAIVQTVAFLIAGWIARRRSPLVMRSRTWRSNAEPPDQQRWFPVFPVRESLRPPTFKESHLLADLPQRQAAAGKVWPDQVLVLYDPWDTYFGEYLAAYYQHRVSSGATVIARPVTDCEDVLPAAERLYLIISPHSAGAMTALVARPDVQDRQFVLVQLEDTKLADDSLSRYQWIDARSDYRRAFQQVGRAAVDLPRRPPPRRNLFSLAQPHPRAVSFAFLAVGFMPLVLSLAPLIILYLYGVNLLGAYLPAAGSARLESLVVDTLLTGLVIYILAAGYWRRCYSTRLILAAWGVFFVTSLLDSWTALPMLALATPFALALLRLSRLPRDVDGVLDGFDWIEMLALGLWQPKKRFEWPLFLLLVLLGGLALAVDAGGSAPAAAPIAVTPTPVDYSGPIGVVGLSIGEEVEFDAAGQIALSGAGTRFSGVMHLYAVLVVRDITPGTEVVFTWMRDGAPINQTAIPWEQAVDWTRPDLLGQVVTGIEQEDGAPLPAGAYVLEVTVGGARLISLPFTIAPDAAPE